MKNSIPIYLVFGPQGSGKSTQAKLLSEQLNLPYFDAGDQLRQFVETGTKEALNVREQMQSGRLVSNDLLRQLFTNFMEQQFCKNGMVADGFPRNLKQVELLDELATSHNWKVLGIYIDIPDVVAKERLSKRYTVVNGRKVVRSDDQPAIVEKRLQVFRRETLPIINYLKGHHTLHDIDGQPSISEVHSAVMKAVNG